MVGDFQSDDQEIYYSDLEELGLKESFEDAQGETTDNDMDEGDEDDN